MRSNKNPVKAVGLLSGGLDSTLATKLMLESGVDVYAINFTSPFCTCTPKGAGCPAAVTATRQLGGIPLKQVALRDEYLEMVQSPKHGYGSGMNPCIDCRILKIRKAGEYMEQIGASFIFTGEVLGQRPMSQQRHQMALIERESGLNGYIVRPLSATHLDETVPEQKGWIDRRDMLGLSGRSRKSQISLAEQKNIKDYPCPAGGCLLTDKQFSERLRDYLRFTDEPTLKDIPLLKVGRHFRLACGSKVIVARNEQECKTMENHYRSQDHLFIPVDFAGPTVILQGAAIGEAIEKMLVYTKRPVNGTDRVAYRFNGQSRIEPLNAVDSLSQP